MPNQAQPAQFGVFSTKHIHFRNVKRIRKKSAEFQNSRKMPVNLSLIMHTDGKQSKGIIKTISDLVGSLVVSQRAVNNISQKELGMFSVSKHFSPAFTH